MVEREGRIKGSSWYIQKNSDLIGILLTNQTPSTFWTTATLDWFSATCDLAFTLADASFAYIAANYTEAQNLHIHKKVVAWILNTFIQYN